MRQRRGYFQVHLGWRVAPPCVLKYRLTPVVPGEKVAADGHRIVPINGGVINGR